MDWRRMGVEGLLQQRAFRLATFEVDGAWGGVLRGNVTSADLFLWQARLSGYDGFIKVPCARGHRFGSKYDGQTSSWYLPLSSAADFRPVGYHAAQGSRRARSPHTSTPHTRSALRPTPCYPVRSAPCTAPPQPPTPRHAAQRLGDSGPHARGPARRGAHAPP